MKRIIFNLTILLITCTLLTGCDETKNDYKNSENPVEYIKSNFKNFYKKDLTLIRNEEKNDSHNSKINLMEFSLTEDENLIFNACSYWESSSVIPVRHYTSVNNYESVYSTKILTENLTEEYGNLSSETKEIAYNDSCKLERNILTLELSDTNHLEELAKKLIYISNIKETYSLHLKVKYLSKSVDIDINNESTLESYITELNKLIEEQTN